MQPPSGLARINSNAFGTALLVDGLTPFIMPIVSMSRGSPCFSARTLCLVFGTQGILSWEPRRQSLQEGSCLQSFRHFYLFNPAALCSLFRTSAYCLVSAAGIAPPSFRFWATYYLHWPGLNQRCLFRTRFREPYRD